MSDLYTIKHITRNLAETQAELDRLDTLRASIYKQLRDTENLIDLYYSKREGYAKELAQWEKQYCIQPIDNTQWQSGDR